MDELSRLMQIQDFVNISTNGSYEDNTNGSTWPWRNNACNMNGTLPVPDRLYIVCSTILIGFCTAALIVNLVILSIVTQKRKFKRTLIISLSLAAADTLSLFFLGLGLVFLSLLPRKFNYGVSCSTKLLIESLRMGAIFTTLFHLAFAAVYHYIGVSRPLTHKVVMTTEKITVYLVLVWFTPLTLVFYDMFIREGHRGSIMLQECSMEFLVEQQFRARYSTMYFIALGLMIYIYIHIFLMAKAKLKMKGDVVEMETEAECGHKPTYSMRKLNRSSVRNNQRTVQVELDAVYGNKHGLRTMKLAGVSSVTFEDSQVNRRMNVIQESKKKEHYDTRNNKARIFNTLLYLASIAFFWTPAFIYFAFFCYDCLLYDYFNPCTMTSFIIIQINNFLLIFKTASNIYLYAIRMKEIKDELQRMKDKLLGRDTRTTPKYQQSIRHHASRTTSKLHSNV